MSEIVAPAGPFRMGRRRAAHAGWGIVDQGVSSLTNFGIALLVARRVGLAEFGAFGLVLSLYVCALWVCRSLCLDPFTVRFAHASLDEQAGAARGVTAAAGVTGAVAGIVLVGIAALGGRSTLGVGATMALALPGLLMQDAYRYVLFAASRSRSAALNDGAWCVTQFAVAAGLMAAGLAGSIGLTAAFGLAASAAAALGACQTGVVPKWSCAWPWLRSQRQFGLLFAGEVLLVVGATQLSLIGVGAVAGIQAIGEFRAALLLFGPLTVVFVGLSTVALPAAVRRRELASSSLSGLVAALGVAMPLIALAWGAFLLVLPEEIGSSLLGSSWSKARHLVTPVAILTAANAAALAAVVGLRALGAARQSLRARSWVLPLVLIGSLLGAGWSGAYGAAIGLAVASWVDAAVVGVSFRRHHGRLFKPESRTRSIAATANPSREELQR